MNIIQKKWEFLNGTVSHAPKQVSKLYQFGLQTIAAEEVVSLRSNARLSGLCWATAKSKIWRMTKNEKVRGVFPSLIASLVSLTPSNSVAVDFSDFGNGFQVLMFAKRTNKGRAVPLYFEILRYPIPKDSQNIFVIGAIRRFENAFGVKPMLVFDRGFMCPSIIRFLLKNEWKFIIRLRKAKHATDPKNGGSFSVADAESNDCHVIMYGHELRLVTSGKLDGMKEPWYLITNDMASTREEIIGCYYHRFEIEEFFRDAKRLLRLEWVTWKNEMSLAVTLWFVILGIFCLNHILEKMDEQEKASHDALRKKMRLSETRYAFELLRDAIYQVAEAPFLVICDS